MDKALDLITLNLDVNLRRLYENRRELVELEGNESPIVKSIDEEIAKLEDLISQVDSNWNGVHPMGQS
jgi:hypothetical protein